MQTARLQPIGRTASGPPSARYVSVALCAVMSIAVFANSAAQAQTASPQSPASAAASAATTLRTSAPEGTAIVAPVKPTAPAASAAPPTAPAVPAAPVVPAKALFGAAKAAAPLAPRAIGYYSRGCLAGGQRLAIDGPEWQAMRLSRNRNWGHPALISFLERFASDARREGWPGLLIGDMSQPRGGPMLTGHASHQVGLDADIWLTPMPDRRLTRQEREEMSAVSMLAPGNLSVETKVFADVHVRILKRAASFGEVERIFVHPAIKKAVCEATATDVDRVWLHKVRPTWGHDHHFHVRIGCPAGTIGCQAQPLPQTDDGCGKELSDWYVLLTAPPKPEGPPVPPPPPLTLDKLPADCRAVLEAPRGQPAATTPQ